METILCQYLKYSFHWKRFVHFLEIYFKRILYYSQWQQIFFFSGDDILSFTFFFFLETIITSRGSQSFYLKHLVSARRNRFLFFFRHWFEWKQLFGPVKSHFSGNASFWLVETDFCLTANFMLLFGAFLCWWTLF